MRGDLSTRKTKTNPSFKYELSEEQKLAKEKILDSKIAIVTGKAGTSKTFLASQIALDLFLKGGVEKMYIARPQVSTEDMGYLPGNKDEKMRQWCAPVIENMEILRENGKKEVEKWLKEGQLELLPLQFARGRTVTNSIMIIDEAQNLTKLQTYLFCTRLGKGSLMIFTGDLRQNDLKQPSRSGFNQLIETADRLDEMIHVELQQNYRDPMVAKFMEQYEKICGW